MRLQKYMADCGVASRRACETIIQEGRVQVNGITVIQLGTIIDEADPNLIITVDGKIIQPTQQPVYILFYKPQGVVTTANDQFGRTCVLDFFKDRKERLYPVGRLDYDTEGLLLLTNDGDFTYKMTHPKHELEKTYIAQVEGNITEEAIQQLRTGIDIDDDGRLTAPAKVRKRNNQTLEIIIHEGRNRQVRKMCAKVGCPVIHLKRIAIGPLSLDGLQSPGDFREITARELEQIGKIL